MQHPRIALFCAGMKWPLRNLKQYLIATYGMDAVVNLFGEMQVSRRRW